MQPKTEDRDRPELVFGLVSAAGARLDDLGQALRKKLASFTYEAVDIRLSSLLQNFTGQSPPSATDEFHRIRHLQDTGDEFRRRLEDGAALARAAIAEIRRIRSTITGNPDRPAPARAYILRQLKHPDEVDLLRRVYGSSFFLVAGHAPPDTRVDHLAAQMARAESCVGQESSYKGHAHDIVRIDEKQKDDYGQNTRDTYPKADFFADLGLDRGEEAVEKLVQLIFGHPFRTPSPDEYAMYQASAAALRSSDDSRQVGAAIVRLSHFVAGRVKTADVVAVGMNEVPQGAGGYYWEGESPDTRDQRLLRGGEDRARELKVSALAELIGKMQSREWFRAELSEQAPSDLARALLDDIKRTQFMQIGEFGRPVHAEMAALIDAARRGVAVDGLTMYVTSFPCHNCAKHIIAAGLRKVVYLEPYPKSRAYNLHREEMVVDPGDAKEQEKKVVFCPFTGIAPRQYQQLFSMSERGAKKGMSLEHWEATQSSLAPRYVPDNAALAYLASERTALEKLPLDVYGWDKHAICPGPGAAND